MINALYWLAVALALLGAWRFRRGRWPRPAGRTAWALLASAGFCLAARIAGLPLSLPLWLAVDVAVAGWIACPLWPFVRAREWRWLLAAFQREVIVLGLFVPMLAAYALDPHPRFVLTTLGGTAQLLAVVPLRRLWRRARATPLPPDPLGDADLRVAAA